MDFVNRTNEVGVAVGKLGRDSGYGSGSRKEAGFYENSKPIRVGTGGQIQ